MRKRCTVNWLAYISGGRGLVIADVSDPSNQKKLREYVIREETQGVQVEGSNVYIASSKGLEILDISDPNMISPFFTLVTDKSPTYCTDTWHICCGQGFDPNRSQSFRAVELIQISNSSFLRFYPESACKPSK